LALAATLALAGIAALGPAPSRAAGEAVEHHLSVSLNGGPSQDRVFWLSDGQLFADIGWIAGITRFSSSSEDGQRVLRHAGRLRVVTLDPDAQTLSESVDNGDTSETYPIRLIEQGGKLLAPVYLAFTYLGATVTFDIPTQTVWVDMPEVTFWEAFAFVFDQKLAPQAIAESGVRLFFDNLVDFINPGGKSIYDLISGGWRKDAIYAAMDANTMTYNAVKTKAAARTESINEVVETIKTTKDAAGAGLEIANLLQDDRLLAIAWMDDPLDRMASYISFFDNEPFRAKLAEAAQKAGTAVDAGLLMWDIANTIYERLNADTTAVKAAQNVFSDKTLSRAGRPFLDQTALSDLRQVANTLAAPGNTYVMTAADKSAAFFSDKAAEAVIAKLAGGSGLIAYELGGVIANLVAISPVGKYTPFAEIPKSEASRMAILANVYYNQAWEVWSGLGERLVEENLHNQETLNAFYYAYVLMLRFGLVWDEAGIKYSQYVKGGSQLRPWFEDRANAVAGALYDLELCSVKATPRLTDLESAGAAFDALATGQGSGANTVIQTPTPTPSPTSATVTRTCPFDEPLSSAELVKAGASCAWGYVEYCDCV
jgi:hypothetical protein